MAFLSGTVSGTGTLYDFTAADPFVYLLEDAVYLCQTSNFYAIAMQVAGAQFYVAGKVASVGYGVVVRNAVGAGITIADTGAVFGRISAIDVDEMSSGVTITNAGQVSSNGFAINVMSDNALKLVNTGTISTTGPTAIQLTGGFDTVRNTGTIIGDIQLGAGDDVFDNRGGAIQGSITGGDGGDIYYVNGDERIIEFYNGTGSDAVYASRDYALSSWIENLSLTGQARNGVGNSLANTIIGSNLGGTLTGAGGDDTISAGNGASIVYGNTGGDNLSGGAADDAVYGGAGDDRILDYAGDNALSGGAGNDYFDPGVDDDWIDGGTGIDVVTFSAATGSVTASLVSGVASGAGIGTDTFKSIENLIGSLFADVLTGNTFANALSGSDGDDVLAGGGGDDVLNGGVGADRLDGGNGVDTTSYAGEFVGARVNLATGVLAGAAAGDVLVSIENLIGSDESDIFVGTDGVNRLDGGAGNDQLTGGAGEDVLTGGAGNDQLTGGSERDVFVFTSLPNEGTAFGADTIKDFQNGTDVISFVGNPFVHDMSDLIISKAGSALVIDIAGFGSVRVLNFAPAEVDPTDFLFG